MDDCAIKEIGSRTYAILHRMAPYEQIPEAIATLRAWLEERRMASRGHPTVVYSSGPNFPHRPPEHSWEIRIPVDDRDDTVPDATGVAIRRIPAELVAMTVHRGPDDQLEATHERLIDWVTEQDVEISGPPMETPLVDHGDEDADGNVTAVMIPIYEHP